MPATQIEVDDADPFIFTSGEWDVHDFGGAFRNTQSVTRRAGAYKTIRFIGTSITVYGGLQPTVGGFETTLIVCQFSIDNGKPTTFAPQERDQYVQGVMFYQSPDIPMGEHVLMMMNIVEDDLLWTDYFVIRGAVGGSDPILLQSDGARVPSRQAPPPKVPSPGGGTSTVVTSIVQTTVMMNSTPVVVPTNPPTIFLNPSSSSQQSPTNNASSILSSSLTSKLQASSTMPGLPAPVTTYQSTIIDAHGNQNPSKPRSNIAAIALGVSGALFLILLIVTLVVLQTRKRRQSATVTREAERFCVPIASPSVSQRPDIVSCKKHIPASLEVSGNDGDLTAAANPSTEPSRTISSGENRTDSPLKPRDPSLCPASTSESPGCDDLPSYAP